MPISADTLRKLLDAGLSGDELVDVVASIDADHSATPKPRSSQALRQERYRQRRDAERHSDVTSDASRDDEASPDKEIPHTPLEINPINSALTPPKGSPLSQPEFDQWYRHYPHKVQRGAAERAFVKARKLASLETLIAGVLRYAAKHDDRPWQNPGTWLNGKGWLDEPAMPTARAGPPGRTNQLSDAFGFLDQGHQNDDLSTTPIESSVLYLPAAARRSGSAD